LDGGSAHHLHKTKQLNRCRHNDAPIGFRINDPSSGLYAAILTCRIIYLKVRINMQRDHSVKLHY